MPGLVSTWRISIRSRAMNCAQRDGRQSRATIASPPSVGATAASFASRASRLASLRSRRFDGARSVIVKRQTVKPRNSEAERDRKDAVEQQRRRLSSTRRLFISACGPVAGGFAEARRCRAARNRATASRYSIFCPTTLLVIEIADHQHDRADVGGHHRAQDASPARTGPRSIRKMFGNREDQERPGVISETSAARSSPGRPTA